MKSFNAHSNLNTPLSQAAAFWRASYQVAANNRPVMTVIRKRGNHAVD